MPAKEIKELRQSGKLDEALLMAQSELDAAPDNIWAKRNISWVYYEYLKQNNSPEQIDVFIHWLNEIEKLQLPSEEQMLFGQLSWQIGKLTFSYHKSNPQGQNKCIQLFEAVQGFHFTKPSEGYSYLFKAFHKSFKENDYYLKFADWWDLQNFMPSDFEKEAIPNGREIMAIAEQAYIAYAKHLLPKQTIFGDLVFNRDKAASFQVILSQIVEDYPQYQYPAYFNAKLLLALGDNDNMLDSLLPFAKKKRNDFWVWQILSEAFSNEPQKVFACYCKALSCKSPEEMLVGLRQKMAKELISRKLYNEARTEIDLLVKARMDNSFRIPSEVVEWQTKDWYNSANSSKSNSAFYKLYLSEAEAILFNDVKEEEAIVEFVNADKKMLNFIVSETKFGFFKYDRFFSKINVGDTIKIRIQGGSNEGMYQIYTAIKSEGDSIKKNFAKEVKGVVKKSSDKDFGFIDDVFVPPSIIEKKKLIDGLEISGTAIKSYNKSKKVWSWKLI